MYRAGLALLFIGAFWSVWAGAQETTVTNAPSVTVTNGGLSGALGNLEKNALTFGLDKIEVLRQHDPLLGEPFWKYLASLIYIVLAFYVSKILDFVIGVWLKRWAAKTDTKYDDLVLELLRGPVKVVAFVVFLHIGLAMFDWPAKTQSYLSKALIIVVACSITYVALKVVDMLNASVLTKKLKAAKDALKARPLILKISAQISFS